MRAITLFVCLLFAAGCGSKTEDAKPAPAPEPSVAYTNATGGAVAVSSFRVFSVTAAPNRPGQSRRAVVVRAVLATGYTFDLTYRYVGSTFPAATGAVTLDEAIQVDYYNAGTPSNAYQAPVASGTLQVESVSPQVVSGTYAGPMVAGGPIVRLTFTRLPI